MTHARAAPLRPRLGLVLATVYAVTAVVYVRAGDNARPLFDGFAPPTPYRWVDPPREFRSGNQPPRPSSMEVGLTPEGSVVASGSSSDGQVILTFPAGAFAGHPTDSRVVVEITPVDPAVLAPPPAGLAADGNAYRLDFRSEPSGQPVAALVQPADVILVVPEPAQTLLHSPEGRAWGNLPFRPVPDPSQVAGMFTAPGYFLAVAPPVGRPSDLDPPPDEGSRLLRVAGVTVALTLALALAPVAVRRMRPGGAAGRAS